MQGRKRGHLEAQNPGNRTSEGSDASFRERASTLVELMRPTQWVKNMVVFTGPAAAIKLTEVAALGKVILAFTAFCLASSATYAINDALDARTDALHPEKKRRPVARGAISSPSAMIFGGILIITATLMTLMLNRQVMVVVLLYFGLTLAYSIDLKHRILLDVIVIAVGFVLRAWAGAAAAEVKTSDWLVICMFTLCLFMGFGKRRCEIAMLGGQEEAGLHRRTLVRYTPILLNHLITTSAGIAIITFLLYTLDASRPTPYEKHQLFYTLPLVCYGVFRYAMITELGIYSGPTEIILSDPGMRWAIILWTLAALWVVYQGVVLHAMGVS